MVRARYDDDPAKEAHEETGKARFYINLLFIEYNYNIPLCNLSQDRISSVKSEIKRLHQQNLKKY